MAEGDDKPDESSKTEEATPKKLEEARKRGQVAQSRDLNTWIVLLAATLLIGTATPYMFAELTDFLKQFLAEAHTMPGTPGGVGIILTETAHHAISATFVVFLALLVSAIIGPMMQVGPMIAPEVLKPDWSKVSIFKGFARLFSIKSIAEFIKGLLKISAIAIVGFVMVYPYLDGVEHTIDLTPVQMLEETKSLAIRMMIGILVALLAIALADLLFQKWEFNKQMRMTKQEIKDEYKQTEGDPFIKGKLKQIRMERARQRMMQNVPKADVVITNPTHYSVALKYDTEVAEAPVVIAKGIDELALRIRTVATDNEVILFENPPLARTLYDTVDIDQQIPEEVYKAVAEIISYVYKKQGKIK